MGEPYDCIAKREALKFALSAFGPGAYRLMVFHLEDRYNVKIESSPCSELADLEDALRDMAGSSADLVITRMRSYLRASKVQAVHSN
jgi:hypothetical protein